MTHVLALRAVKASRRRIRFRGNDGLALRAVTAHAEGALARERSSLLAVCGVFLPVIARVHRYVAGSNPPARRLNRG
ncbi:MAG: hypothetical protein R3D02_05415 [Hyphomicrobiales bacterium]